MNRYVKKPIAIEAVKWKGFNNDEIKDFAGDSVKIEVIREGDDDNGIPPSVDCSIETLEGVINHHTIPLSSCYYPYHHNQDELDPCLLHKVCQVSY